MGAYLQDVFAENDFKLARHFFGFLLYIIMLCIFLCLEFYEGELILSFDGWLV